MKNIDLEEIYRISFLILVLLTICVNPAQAQEDNYVSTGYCRFMQGGWEKGWTPGSEASFVINRESGEIRFDHAAWASRLLKINRIENSQTEEGTPLIIYNCTEPANGSQWELRFNEWTVFDEASYYHYYRIDLISATDRIRFMTRKSE